MYLQKSKQLKSNSEIKASSTFARVLQDKIGMPASFNITLTHYISDESLLNVVYDKIQFKQVFVLGSGRSR